MSYNIVVLDGIYANPGDLSWEPLNEYGDVTIYERTSPDQVLERAANADILIINKIKLGATEFEKLPNLQLVIISATGMDNVDLDAAKKYDISVKNVSGYSTQSVAQHVFSMILTLYNQVEAHDQSVKNGEWNSDKGFSYLLSTIPELSSKTITVVGYGQIGSEVAKVSKAFGMEVLIVSNHSKHLDDYELVSLEEGFKRGDIVSLHWPMTPEREGLINRKLLRTMKPSAILINTARGGLINESDLADALKDKIIAAAALDVMINEPPVTNHPLLMLSNCIVTPHIAWASSKARSILLKKVFDHVANFKTR